MEMPMRQEAFKMIAGMMALAVVIAVTTDSPMVLLITAAVSYSVWHVAKGFDE